MFHINENCLEQPELVTPGWTLLLQTIWLTLRFIILFILQTIKDIIVYNSLKQFCAHENFFDENIKNRHTIGYG